MLRSDCCFYIIVFSSFRKLFFIPNLYTSERLSLRVFEQFGIDFGRCDMFMNQHFAYGVDN